MSCLDTQPAAGEGVWQVIERERGGRSPENDPALRYFVSLKPQVINVTSRILNLKLQGTEKSEILLGRRKKSDRSAEGTTISRGTPGTGVGLLVGVHRSTREDRKEEIF